MKGIKETAAPVKRNFRRSLLLIFHVPLGRYVILDLNFSGISGYGRANSFIVCPPFTDKAVGRKVLPTTWL
jgi:hypothetical protein